MGIYLTKTNDFDRSNVMMLTAKRLLKSKFQELVASVVTLVRNTDARNNTNTLIIVLRDVYRRML